MTDKKIGWIGTGNLGSAIVRKLLKEGYTLYVYNRTKSKLDSLKKIGANIVNSPSEMLDKCNVIFLCLSGEIAIENVLFNMESGVYSNKFISDVHGNKVIVDLSTINPQFAKYLSNKIQEYNSNYIEAPVSGGPEGAKQGTLSMISSGNSESIEIIKPIINSFTNVNHTFHTPGKAQLLKVLNNLAESINLMGAAEVVSLGIKEGLSLKEMSTVFNSTRGYSTYMGVLFERLLASDDNVSASLNVRLKDLELAEKLFQNGKYTPVSELIHKLFKDAISATGGDTDQSNCIKIFNE